jgi:UDP-3-O-[3-hydroxymyristoyl] glucosamine N-acyltransferase
MGYQEINMPKGKVKSRFAGQGAVKRTVADIKKFIGSRNCTVIGNIQREFSNIQSIHKAMSGDLTFCVKKGEEAVSILKKTKASIVICDIDVRFRNVMFDDKTLVIVNKPRLWFMRCMHAFFPQKSEVGIHPTAVIGKNCQIGKDVYIGPHVFIDDGVVIGSGTKIYSNVSIRNRVKIGKNVTIKSGCAIGGDGFGYERNDEGLLEKFPHVGGVVIEDNVEIGSNTCVDRGTLSDTIIGKGTKIDNLVHVAHNVVIGKHCAIIALAMIGGGANIGDGAWVAPTACIRDGIVIGKQSLVGMGAVVTKNVDDGDVVIGVPAKSIKEAKR